MRAGGGAPGPPPVPGGVDRVRGIALEREPQAADDRVAPEHRSRAVRRDAVAQVALDPVALDPALGAAQLQPGADVPGQAVALDAPAAVADAQPRGVRLEAAAGDRPLRLAHV